MDPHAAPVALFVYGRPEHTRRTLNALVSNRLAPETDLIVYADGPRSRGDEVRVREVEKVVQNVQGFRSVNVIQRSENFGLARNIIEGVSEVCQNYGRVVVLEDDIVTGRYFLSFMNSLLDHYEDEKRVWHVSGWNYPINSEGLGSYFFWRAMNCWGWATWADRWRHFERNPGRIVGTWDRAMIRRFNLDGAHDFWAQITANSQGLIRTWAIFWYATIFEREGLCVNPRLSYTKNIGLDGSGEHCGKTMTMSQSMAKSMDTESFGPELVENEVALQRIRRFYRDRRDGLLKRGARLLRDVFP